MNTLDLAQRRVQMKKASSIAGGEWQGPCPGCGGTDRFHVWPAQCDGRGAYWCRGCGKWGDNIQFLRDFEGLGFREACARLQMDVPEAAARWSSPVPRREKPEFVPATPVAPADLWREKAEKFVTWAQANISMNDEIRDWLKDRGINIEAIVNFRLGWNPGEDGKDLYRSRKAWGLPEQIRDDGRPKALWLPRGLIIPYMIDGVVHRIRIRRPEGEPRYYVLPGSSMATMLLDPARRAFVVVESELDGIAVATGNSLAGAVALGSAAAKPDAAAYAVLKDAVIILNALDYDAAGAKAMTWWTGEFRNCARWPVPKGKDPGEAFRQGIDLNSWIKAGLPPALTISEPPPVRDRRPEIRHGEPNIRTEEPPLDLHPGIIELRDLLRKNPTVKIINTPTRFTVLRDGKYVGGRINELVFRTSEVTDYLMKHPDEEIDGGNLISRRSEPGMMIHNLTDV